jgi:hypothetical protein
MKEVRTSLKLTLLFNTKELLTLVSVDVLTALLFFWSGWSDSNRRPPTPHAGALPDWATPRRSKEYNTPEQTQGVFARNQAHK